MKEIYIDIETAKGKLISVLGIYITDVGFFQFLGPIINTYELEKILPEGEAIVYTFNGQGFDLPFIKRSTGIDFAQRYRSIDLMREFRQFNIRGGQKKIEKYFNIERNIKGVHGRFAYQWGNEFIHFNNKTNLEILKEYNKEDVMNMVELKKILDDIKKKNQLFS